MASFNIALCVTLFAFTHRIIALNTSDIGLSEDKSRQPKVTGRIVKLYSGSRPDPILCTEEGFKADPNDCSVFYRCVNSGRGKFTVLRFSCGPGTVYDPDIEVCNHPRSTKRSECNGGIFYNPVTEKQFLGQENEIDSVLEQLPPSPINIDMQFNSQRTTKRQSITSTTAIQERTTKRQSTPSSTTKPEKILPTSHTTTIKSVNIEARPKNKEDICTTDGFVGDTENCRTFYRCVANGRGGFIRYEFSCSESTMWDDDIQSCNHAWAIKRRRCGRDNNFNEQNKNLNFDHQNDVADATVQAPYFYGNKNIPKNTNNNVPQKSTTKKSVSKSDTTTTEKYIEEKVFVEKQNYGSEIENYDDNINDEYSTSTKSTSLPSTTTSSNGNLSDQDMCTASGFMGDSHDCRKFYRCVDNSKGGYTKYEFTCGEGTVWDSKIEACNHAWAVEKCGGLSSTTSTQSSTTIENTQSTTESNDYEDSSYNHSQKPVEPAISEKPENINANQDTTTESVNNNDNNKCVTSGFMGNKNDCKKFYRCVEDGKGDYTKYEFTCGDGTVWDSEIESCNHESAVKDCNKSSQTSSLTAEESSTTQKTTTTKNTAEEISTSTTTTTTQATSIASSSSQTCTKEGFMGDSSDCKKFYRCVDNGQGGFIKYEFSCGEGTEWDPDIQSCNHQKPNKKCGSSEQSNSQNSQQENENGGDSNGVTQVKPDSTTTEKDKSTTEKETSTTTTQMSTINSKDDCKTEGFHGDSSDCKKFYRCVDNGNGGYTKYDFICGEGTIWDQEIQGCNHGSNSKCSKDSQSSQSQGENQQTTSNIITNVTTEQSTSAGTTSSSPSTNKDICQSEGFFANSIDCKKFYRCVGDGKSGYTKYDFSCGEGTVWVQEIQACDHDNDLKSCTINNDNAQMSSTTSSTSAASNSQTSEHEDDEYPQEDNSTTNKSPSGKCTSEGYYGDESDCRKFYRCVDNGNNGYTKYDFTCGDGTAWDTDLQTCNHENDVKTCKESNQSQQSNEEDSQTTQKTSTTQSNANSGSTTASSNDNGSNNNCKSSDKCEKEGYCGNTQDCTKFYRCVDNGNGGLTKYDFDCGEGTIWDQDVQTCNHPGDVQNPSCSANSTETCSEGGDNSQESGTTSTTSQSSTQTSSTTQSNNETSDSSTQNSSDCSQNSTEKPKNDTISCPKAGFYANPNDCKKFYRCVDWDGDGQRYSVFHFDCGEGTIWDPELETCNYEESVYPPRDCSGKQSASESGSSTTTQKSTTEEKDETTTTEKGTTESTTTEKSTTKDEGSSTSEQTTTSTTTEQSTTEEQTTTSTTEKTTTEQSTTEESTTKQSTTEQTTTEQTTDKSTTQESTTKQSTTEESTTEQSTTEQSTTEESTTKQTTTEESTTEQSTTEQSSTEQSTTEESTTEQSTTAETTTKETTTEESTTEALTTEASTTEGSTTKQSTTEESTTDSSSTESSSTNKECPETEDDQYLYVCPTGFRRHPKYCNLFYQCTEDDDSHEVKVAVFNCPNNTIYDESKTQCVEESEADKKCDGEMAERRRFKRLDTEHRKTPIIVSTNKRTCTSAGHYPFEKSDECSPAFMKCVKSKSGEVRGYVYRCPEKHVYWSVSRRCEPMFKVRHCKNIDQSWSKRWEIPYETKNIAQ